MKLSAYEFAAYVDLQIESYPENEYLLRTGRDKKKVIEEFWPLSRLALALKQPGLDVQVEAHEDTKRSDGYIWITGFRQCEFTVEVTTAGYNEKEALRSELLVQQGFAPGTGKIDRQPKSRVIVAETTADDTYEPIRRLAVSIRERSIAKSMKLYPDGTFLIIAFQDFKLCGRGWWRVLFEEIDRIGGIDKSNFAKVYLFNCFSNELLQVA